MMSKSGDTFLRFYPRLDFRSRSGTLCRRMSSLGGRRNFSLTSHAASGSRFLINPLRHDTIYSLQRYRCHCFLFTLCRSSSV